MVQDSSSSVRHQGVMITPLQQMVSSCTGAFITAVLVTPLDVVKIRLQAQKKPNTFARGNCFLYCNGLMDHVCACLNGQNIPVVQTWYKKPGHFSGTLDAFVKIVRNEGITSLWSGLPPTLLMAVPATVIYFTTYEQLKAFFGYRERVDEWWKPMTSGAIARVWSATVISPIEMVRVKMQSEHQSYKQLGIAVYATIKNNGILSLWTGLGPTLFRDVPFSAFYWLSYEVTKAKVLQKRGSPELTFSEFPCWCSVWITYLTECGSFPTCQEKLGQKEQQQEPKLAGHRNCCSVYKRTEDNAISLPAREFGFKREDIHLLLSAHPKSIIFRLYVDQATQVEFRVVGFSTFLQLWIDLCPYIVVTKPMSDQCWQCQQNNSHIYQSANLTEEEKIHLVLEQQQQHLGQVKSEGKLYQAMTTDAKKQLPSRKNFNDYKESQPIPGTLQCTTVLTLLNRYTTQVSPVNLDPAIS